MAEPALKPPPPAPAYDADYALWLDAQIAALKAGDWRALDIEHLTDELQDVGHSERDEIESRLVILLAHLLKWAFQPAARSRSWQGTIREQRRRIEKRLKISPSLQRYPANVLADAYVSARDLASGESDLPLSTFPETCPYAIDDILNPDFWPGPVEPRMD